MKEINIKVPEGYIIDKENSSLDKGTIVFKKKDTLPNTWEEYYNSLSERIKFGIDNALSHLSWFPDNIKYKYIALFKLELLRDVYRQGWKPDYIKKYTGPITISKQGNGDIHISDVWSYVNHFLSFKDRETCKLFINNFKDLIKKAEDLI